MEATTEAGPVTVEMSNRDKRTNAIIKRHMYWAMGFGIIPFPVVDVAAVTAVQLKMIASLADLYGQEFSRSWGKSILGALVGGVGAAGLAYGTFGSMVKAIPGVGTLFGMVAMPIMAGATTYAVGKVFNLHFSSGGTMLNFDVQKMRCYYEQQLQEGVKVAENATASGGSASASSSSGDYGSPDV